MSVDSLPWIIWLLTDIKAVSKIPSGTLTFWKGDAGSVQQPFCKGERNEVRGWWVSAAQEPSDVYAWVVQPAGLWLREIKVCAHSVGYVTTGLIKRAWIQSREIWVALACPLCRQMTLGQFLPMPKVPHSIRNERVDSSTDSSWKSPWLLLLHWSRCVCFCWTSRLIHGFQKPDCIWFQIQC